MRNCKWQWLPAAVLLCAAVAPAPAGAVTVSAPPSGAVVSEARVVVSGRAGGSTVTVRLNGKDLPAAAVTKGFFSLPVTLAMDTNRLEFRAGSETTAVTIEYRPGGAYRFHPGYGEGECGDCHEKGLGHVSSPTESGLCHSCHDRKDGAGYLHGPVGAGQCTACHDPHGSAEKAFLKRAGTVLCVACHDQPGSRKHMDGSRGKACVVCHDPHGSEKRYFLD